MTPQSQRHLVFLLLLAGLLWAGRAGAQSHYFQQYSVREGLAQSNVYDILQDARGYVWMGTASGVSRFDGLEFRNFSPADGLSDNGVRTLLVDARGVLWLGHNGGGISLIGPDTICAVLQLDGDITKLLEDRQGRIWAISSTGGAVCITNPEAVPETVASFQSYKAQAGLSDRIFGMAQRADGTLYFITDVGIKQYVAATDSFAFFRPEGLPGYFLPTCMMEAADGILWFGTHNGGLYRYDTASKALRTFDQLKDGLAHNFISTLAEDADGNIWAGTWGGGLSRIAPDYTITNFSANNGLQDDKVRCIAQDAEGNVLIGTNENGLMVYKSEQFLRYGTEHGLVDNQVWAIEQDGDAFWIGTNAGLAYYQPRLGLMAWSTALTKAGGLPSDNVRCLKLGPDKQLWIGTWGGGIVAFDMATGALDYNFELNYNIPFGNVTSLDIGADSTVWIGTSDGLLRYRTDGSFERITQETDANGQTIGLPGNDISVVRATADGSVWVGSRGQGVTHFSPATREFEELEWSQRFTANCLFEDGEGTLWIGTEGSGLLTCKNNRIGKQYRAADGLLSDYIATIDAGENGLLWIGTNRGLNKLDVATGGMSSYGQSDGFTGIEVKPNASLSVSGSRLARGTPREIWYGTVNGIMVNRTALERSQRSELLTHIGGLRVNLQAHELMPGLRLSHHQNNLIFDFNAISLYDPAGVRYKVMLEGLESDWRTPSAQAFANYTAVPPGNYTLKVKSISGAGIESSTPQTYSFSIAPPFWKTWWFSLACIVLLAALIVSWIKYRERALKQEKERLEVQVAERTAEVVQQKEALADANVQLEAQHRDIVDSIRYAERIQRAILPVEQTMAQHLHDVFVLFQPKDIVSGDFYWFAESQGRVYFSAIDCTGHGVPGAFVSLIGNNGLQKAVNELGLQQPGEILDALRTFVVNVFQQQGSGEAIRDGMDMALCAFDSTTGTLEYAGAKNPMYLVRNGEVSIIKGDKMPVGASETDEVLPFTNHSISLQEGDCVYLFSDGFADQFGGPQGKKFKYRPFQELLLELHKQPMQTQKEVLSKTINDWMQQPGSHYEQIDDILVLGVRF